jgi:hypothetical protein
MKINPVRATMQKYDKNCDLAEINDTCYGICAAFSNTTDPYRVNPECAKACNDYIERMKLQIYGVGNCDHQAPYRPVIWDSPPRYIPSLIKKMSPVEALPVCKQMCATMVPNLKDECIDRCNLDYNAIDPEDRGEMPSKMGSEMTVNDKQFLDTTDVLKLVSSAPTPVKPRGDCVDCFKETQKKYKACIYNCYHTEYYDADKCKGCESLHDLNQQLDCMNANDCVEKYHHTESEHGVRNVIFSIVIILLIILLIKVLCK